MAQNPDHPESMMLVPVQENFVAEFRGERVGPESSQSTIDCVQQALDRYGVVFVRDNPLTKEELVGFAARFGDVDTELQVKRMTVHQDRMNNYAISDISNVNSQGELASTEDKQYLLNIANRRWHSDMAFAEYPSRYTILSAVTAVSWGGETQFADLRAAYDDLDDRTKALIEDKVAEFYAIHSATQLGLYRSPEEAAAYPPVRWPMVRTHPASGRKLIWCDTKVHAIVGMSVPEARSLVEELVEHITQREHVYSHHWQPGDLLLADNRSTLHRGKRFDNAERREMRRVNVRDDVPAFEVCS